MLWMNCGWSQLLWHGRRFNQSGDSGIPQLEGGFNECLPDVNKADSAMVKCCNPGTCQFVKNLLIGVIFD